MRVVLGTVTRRAVRSGLGWGVVFGIVVLSSALGFVSSYKDPAARLQLTRTLGSNVGLHALFGVPHRIDTVAGFTAWRSIGLLTLVGGVWAVLLATKLLRGEEEAGRWELLLAGGTTRGQAAAAGMTGLAAGAAVLFAVTAAVTVAVGGRADVAFSVGSSLYLALALAAAPVLFLAVGALCSQVAATRRQAASLASLVLGLSYALRLVGDSGRTLHWLAWISPLGWVHALQPMGNPHPWVLVLIGGLAAALAGSTAWLASARDYGASALPDRDAAAPRLRLLGSPLGLAVRLGRGSLYGWLAAVAALGATVGMIAKSVGEATAGSNAFQQAMERLGAASKASRPNGAVAYLGLTFVIFAALVALQAAGHVSATRDEEAQGYVDNLLVRPVARVPWLLGRLAVAVAAVGVVGVASGLATWVGAATQHTGVGFAHLVGAGVNVLPAAVFVLGTGTLAQAVAPRRAGAFAYGVVAWSFLVELVGSMVKANHWLLDLSLFHHLAAAPAVAPRWEAGTVLMAVGVAGGLAALALFRRRDLAVA